MTASEFLDTWAASPDSEMFIGVRVDERSYVAGRLKASDFGRVVVHGKFGQLEKLAIHPEFLSSARVESIKGVTCLIIEREAAAPWEVAVPSHQDYCVVLAPADVFGA